VAKLAIDIRPRCRSCRKLLAEKVTRPWIIGCGRCKTLNTDSSQGLPRTVAIIEDVAHPCYDGQVRQ
jgi:phage FluMu protein Com